MFDVGFSELLVIGAVALVVIGPERLPKVARTVGHLLGRMQRYVNDVKSDIGREMQLDELKKLQTQIEESARTFETSVRDEISTARSSLEGIQKDTLGALEELEADARKNLTLETPVPPVADVSIPDAAPFASVESSLGVDPVAAFASPVSEPENASAEKPSTSTKTFDQTTPVA